MMPGESEQKASGQVSTSPAKGDSSDTQSNTLPSISLPKGGGAIRGIGEKFSANPVTGTGSLSVPIFTTPSRSDFYPKLSLSYDSGAGNGSFGIGWNLSIPSITRKTDKGLPRYQDAVDSDIYILSEAEDLVPSFTLQGNTWTRESGPPDPGYIIWRYRPRVEGLFARIERWEDKTTGEVHWRSVSKDNITSLYGTDAKSRIADPDDSRRVFKWLLAESYDDKGNAILYEYKEENDENVDRSLPQEFHRLTDKLSFANRYVKRIYYGNTTSRQQNGGPLPAQDYLFQVVFDYGEHNLDAPTPEDGGTWACRPDPFSSFRACFEIRSYRLCRRVLIFHAFKELGDGPCLVRSTDFTYAENPVATYLTAIMQSGYIKHVGTSAGYDKKSLPPLEITYTQAQVDETLHFVDAGSLENLPMGLDGKVYQWVDLDNEGLSGILTQQADAWFYKRNLGDAQFAPVQLVAAKPSPSNLQSGQQQLIDLVGDGHKYLVQFSPPLQGFYEHVEDGENGDWGPFTPFLFSPNVAWNDPNLKFIDLDGDGHSDILLSEDEVFSWYRSLARDGFGPAETVRKPFDEEKGPTLVFADATQSIYLADMTGDGLTDIVRVRNGEICYWPNKGYGNFGFKVTMDAAPLLDYPDYFDQKSIRFADIDGSGTTDIIYLGRDTISFWFNQAGNSWSEPHTLRNFPATDDLSSVTVVDLLGNGTACIVWSSPLPADVRQPMRYIDLMGGQKPHLVQVINNNMGTETKLQYAASTKFYLADQVAGTPWVTKLPFPVHVVERVETHDAVSETTLITRYSYHHGYYDGVEREFRGFGLVEQWDSESFVQFMNTVSPTGHQIVEEDLFVPPVHTKSWFHTGAYLDRKNISQHFAHEYYPDKLHTTDKLNAPLLPDTPLPPGLTAQEEQEACRALKGRVLRQEIYADDGSSLQEYPYTITEHTYAIKMLQPVLNNPHSVFYAYESEVMNVYCERHPEDPRIGHSMTLEVDPFGNVTKSAAIGYPRLPQPSPDPDLTEQGNLLMTYTEADFMNKPNEASFYRVGVPSETRTYELTGIAVAMAAQGPVPLEVSDILTVAPSAQEIFYEAEPTSGAVQKRLIECARSHYYKDDLSGPLPLGEVESHALPYENYKLAFTPGLLQRVYGSRVDTPLLKDKGRYIQGSAIHVANNWRDTAWWVPSGRRVNDARQFYLPVQFIDPFGNISTVTYDTYALLVIQATDALPLPLQNVVQARNNYRSMLPELLTDPNKNSSLAFFDALGMVTETVVMGKNGEGDTLADPTTKLEYDLFNWMQHQKPNFVHISAREQHGPSNPRWQESYSYSDGLGREVMKKVQAEPGLALYRDANGDVVRKADNQPDLKDTSPSVRWVGTGRTIYDNKGNPVKKYEPFFDNTYGYVTEKDLVEWGVTPILHYDPLGRLIRTDNPNGTFSRREFDAWEQITSDENDTVLESKWYAARGSPQLSDPEPKDPETRAAWLAVNHANTPSIAHFDSLGRTFLTIASNGSKPEDQYKTRVKLDIEGNQRVIIDALKREAEINDYNVLGGKIHTKSIDAGERWIVQNVVDLPLRAWDSPEGDSQGHQVHYLYDELRRPTHLFMQQGTNAAILAERTVYGEAHPDADPSNLHPNTLNLRSKIYQHYDGAGVITNEQYDFKGNLLRGKRQLAQEYRHLADWSPLDTLTDVQSIASAAVALLEGETFTTSTTYDALNRPTSITMPDKSEILPAYNEANLLEKLDVHLRGETKVTSFIKNLDYNARGQRELVEYGNGVRTTYTYDRDTFRLTNLKTKRPSDPDKDFIQNLIYTYDPVGNITEIQDEAQQTIFFNNAKVAPSMQYVYDALYWLTSASGREHAGQNAPPPPPWAPEYDYNDFLRTELPHPNDWNAMQNYTEEYAYDHVGNIKSMTHSVGGITTWKRLYDYPVDRNRLRSTSQPGDSTAGPFSARYSYDIHGNMTTMPHLQQMQWDFKDQLHQVDLGGGGTAYYIYDASGHRVRKVVESGSLIKERIYVGGYEIYRERNGSGPTLARETLHVMDDKKRVALVETKTIDTQDATEVGKPLLRYQLDNHLGSAVLELENTGAVISYEEYYPYGGTSYQAGRSKAEVSLKRYRYTGKERDEESGLYYHEARYYAPWLGRWISSDPLGLSGGPQENVKTPGVTATMRQLSTILYQYSSGNPLKYIDATGFAPRKPSDEDKNPVPLVLGSPETLQRYAQVAKDVRNRWSSLTSNQRFGLLTKAAVAELRARNIHEPLDMGVFDSQKHKNLAGGFISKRWVIVLREEFFTSENPVAAAEAAKVVLHEFEHLAETYEAARYLAATSKSSASAVGEIVAVLRIKEEIAREAMKQVIARPLTGEELRTGREYFQRKTSEPLDYYNKVRAAYYEAKQKHEDVSAARNAKFEQLLESRNIPKEELFKQIEPLQKAQAVAYAEMRVAHRVYQMTSEEFGSTYIENLLQFYLRR